MLDLGTFRLSYRYQENFQFLTPKFLKRQFRMPDSERLIFSVNT